MNKHDLARRDALVRTLAKAKELAENARVHLIANDREQEDIEAMSNASALAEKALEVLGAKTPEGAII
ncbi:hypothetical protein [Cohnella massiliensis]|uniref:hypothetical protein n=1 Tax=Cohnella massiliensis TaxID=1816691 RepID=UPI0009BAA8E0|nr:hypothetical protein [Cohnella massiliensis]